MNELVGTIAAQGTQTRKAIREASRTNTAELRLLAKAVVHALTWTAIDQSDDWSVHMAAMILGEVYGPDAEVESKECDHEWVSLQPPHEGSFCRKCRVPCPF